MTWTYREYREQCPNGVQGIKPADMIRFSRFVRVCKNKNGCWEWTGYKDHKGYGQFRLTNRAYWAHRISFAVFAGPLFNDMQVDHLCQNPSCVRPDHLEAVTAEENRRRQHGSTPEETYDEIPF